MTGIFTLLCSAINIMKPGTLLQELATQCTSALGFPESEVEAALESIRLQAVKRLSGNSMYKETCVATLELILPKTLKKVPNDCDGTGFVLNDFYSTGFILNY